jgi:hypothetical protein
MELFLFITYSCFQLARVKKQIDAMWDAADAEVQTTYGKDYYDALYKAVEGCRPHGYPTLDPANEAFIDALTNENPEYRYLVDGAKATVDNYCVSMILRKYIVTVEHIVPKNTMSPMGFDPGTSRTVSHRSTN